MHEEGPEYFGSRIPSRWHDQEDADGALPQNSISHNRLASSLRQPQTPKGDLHELISWYNIGSLMHGSIIRGRTVSHEKYSILAPIGNETIQLYAFDVT